MSLVNITLPNIIGIHNVKLNDLIGSHIGNIVMIPRIKIATNPSDTVIPFVRLQFPVRLAFCMTINKSQGQTLDYVGLYLPSPVFSHGQLYVAMSRVSKPSAIKILIGNSSDNASNHVTKNVVYNEVFQSPYTIRT